jgi:hypothetical protein
VQRQPDLSPLSCSRRNGHPGSGAQSEVGHEHEGIEKTDFVMAEAVFEYLPGLIRNKAAEL